MQIELCTPSDFFEIRRDIADFWGSNRTLYLHHPMLVYEFGNTAFVIRGEGTVAAYLMGFFSQTAPVAYVHLVGVRESWKRRGLGLLLYRHFTMVAQAAGMRQLKAITTPDNHRSIAFHTLKVGMQMAGEAGPDGVPVIRDYSGPGSDRVVFIKDIVSEH